MGASAANKASGGPAMNLAEEYGLCERREAMFRGERINVSEKRAVLHVALRMPRGTSLIVDGVDVVEQVHAVLDRMREFSDSVRSGRWLGHIGKRIRNVVNIGIGGSDLGPVMASEALRHYSEREMTFRFVSNVDSTDLAEALRDLDPAETLFTVCSKTFGTQETLTNATSARLARRTARRRVRRREALRRRVDQCKALAVRILPELKSAGEPELAHDSSTNALIRRYRRLRRGQNG